MFFQLIEHYCNDTTSQNDQPLGHWKLKKIILKQGFEKV